MNAYNTYNKIKEMNLDELVAYITENEESFLPDEVMALHDRLGDLLWHIGGLWDKVDGTDINRGSSTYGTPNHRSMTYKCRKLAGFTYP